MRGMKRSPLAPVLLLALVGASVGGAPAGGFERKPVDRNLITNIDPVRGRYQYVQFSNESTQVHTLPEGVEHDVRYGLLTLEDGESWTVVACASQPGGFLDTLYIDVKGSGDLTDAVVVKDLPFSRQHDATVPLPDGRTINARITIFDSYLMVQLDPYWWLGAVEIDGQTRMAALVDRIGDGLQVDEGDDLLLIDLDGSGVFEIDPDQGMLGEIRLLQSEIVLGGAMYDLVLETEEKTDVQLTPYQGPLGWLSLDVQLNRTPRSYHFTASYMTGDGGALSGNYVFCDSTAFPLPFKPTTLERMSGLLFMRFDNGDPMFLQFEVWESLTFKADTTTTLTIGPHDPMEVTVIQMNDQLRVAQSLNGPDGIRYQRILQRPETDEAEDTETDGPTVIETQTPQVTILDADGQVLAQGAMEYG